MVLDYVEIPPCIMQLTQLSFKTCKKPSRVKYVHFNSKNKLFSTKQTPAAPPSVCNSPIALLTLLVALASSSVAGQRIPVVEDTMLLHPKTTDDNVLLIGAVFPIHRDPLERVPFGRIPNTDDGNSCSQIQLDDGIQVLEAFLFALDEVNRNESLLPGITLGGLALDSCDSPKVALNHSVSFIKGHLASQNTHHADFRCQDGQHPSFLGGRFDKVVGIIGGQKSSVSVQMANVLKLFDIPQVSYQSTSVSLSSVDMFPYFLRTVPPDNEQAEVMLRIMRHQNWTYAQLVYASTEYGVSGRGVLLEKAGLFGVCFAQPVHALDVEDSDMRYHEVAAALIANTKAKVVVLFAGKSEAKRLLEKFRDASHGSDHGKIFLGSDGWTNRKVDNGIQVILENAIAVQPLIAHIPGFESYFTELKPRENTRNPWFREYWEDVFKCSLGQISGSRQKCKEIYSLKTSHLYRPVGWLHFVRDAVYAFAHALHRLWEKHCGEGAGVSGSRGMCAAMLHEGHMHGSDLLQELKEVSFPDVTGQLFRFDANRSGLPRYTIFQFQHLNDKTYDWRPVANYSKLGGVEPDLTWEMDTLWSHEGEELESQCSAPCLPGQARIQKEPCCWECLTCTEHQFLNTSRDEGGFCDTCGACYIPSSNATRCDPKPAKHLDYSNHWVVTATVFAGLGILTTFFVAIIFVCHLHTPVIRAASRELSFILLTGILLSFAMTFAIVAPPTPILCAITRFFLGFSYTLCYAAILTKTNRISRIFKGPVKAIKAKYTSPSSQVLIVLGLVSIEVAINITWLLYAKPEVAQHCDIKITHKILLCKGIEGYSYLVGLLYPLLLVFFCTVYAIKTRKCPGGFNEARYIAFTNYTTCVIWVVFVPLYLSKAPSDETRIVSLAFSLSLGGFVQLGCLFLPKVHLVVFKPNKNTRDLVMSQQSYASSGGRGPRTAGHQSAPAALTHFNGVNNRTTSLPCPSGHNSQQLNTPPQSIALQREHLHTLPLTKATTPAISLTKPTLSVTSEMEDFQESGCNSIPSKSSVDGVLRTGQVAHHLAVVEEEEREPKKTKKPKQQSQQIGRQKQKKELIDDDELSHQTDFEVDRHANGGGVDGRVNTAYMTLNRK